ncbi:MAG: hypothetical protein JNG84_04515, partial [Archangium sp.]|nr:hypothetical protein [Archangium sp.]
MALHGRWLALVVVAGFGLLACGPEESVPLDEGVTSEDKLRDDSCRPSPGGANADVANLAKYWAYRARLKAEFVKVSAGDEPGTNLPAGVRANGRLGWGDTTIMLGQYLAMLATEYKLVGGAQTEKGRTAAAELYYALKALDRLDRTGETYFPGGSATVNGFFVRDDVPGDFLTRFPLRGATSVESEITCPYQTGGEVCHPTYRATEMSQDQVWHLILGLALVKRMVPENAILIDGQNVNLRAYTKTLTDRILRYMRTSGWQTVN